MDTGLAVRPQREAHAPWSAPPCPEQVDPACLGQLGLGTAVLTRSRANGFLKCARCRRCHGCCRCCRRCRCLGDLMPSWKVAATQLCCHFVAPLGRQLPRPVASGHRPHVDENSTGINNVLPPPLYLPSTLCLIPYLPSPLRLCSMLEAMKKRARQLAGDLPRFPSLLITADGTSAQGTFAEAQARAPRCTLSTAHPK